MCSHTHTYAKGVKYNLEQSLLAPQWALCLEVPYHFAVTLAGSLSFDTNQVSFDTN